MHPTQIRRLDIYRLRIPLRQPFVISRETITHAENIALCIETADGLTGWGECSPYRSITGESPAGAFPIAVELGQLLLGRPASNIGALLDRLDAFLHGNYSVKSAFDMALYDLAARRQGQSLADWLGGRRLEALRTDMTIGLDAPEAMAAAAAGLVADGFDTVKIKLGEEPERDIARVRAIRERVGPDIALRVDANQGWTETEALRVLRALAPMGVAYCEAPIPRHLAWRLPSFRRRSPIPLMADEALFDHHDAARLAAEGSCDYFNIKLAKSGGIRNALRILAIADSFDIDCQIGCFSESRLALSAFAQLALAHPRIRFHDLDSALMLAEDPVQGGIEYGQGGHITVGEAPGHGATFDPDWLEQQERRSLAMK